MLRLNVHQAKTHLSRYLERVLKGERILLCRRNVPIAEIRPLRGQLLEPRKIGLCSGWSMAEEFFEPLPNELLDAFDNPA